MHYLWFVIGAVFIGGYTASCYTWPWEREKLHGAVNEAEQLRDRARTLERKVLDKAGFPGSKI